MPEQPLFLTRHARNRMRRDNLSEGVVEDCVRHPESVVDSFRERKNYWRRYGAEYVRVTIVEESDRIVVITATLKRKGPD